jgi:phenol 2-monooxygenase
MPVFQETSSTARDLRIFPSRALPLPKLSPKPDYSLSAEEKHEVVVIGVGVFTMIDEGSLLTPP